MSKKRIFILIEVFVMLIAGFVLCDFFPSIGGFIAFIELTFGFISGSFYRKYTMQDNISDICLEYEKDIAGLKNEILALNEELKGYKEQNTAKKKTAKA